jgi:hypothetical protein
LKSKGLVIAGSILVIISLMWPIVLMSAPSAEVKVGPIEISGTEAEEAINLFFFAVIFFAGIGLIVRGFIELQETQLNDHGRNRNRR